MMAGEAEAPRGTKRARDAPEEADDSSEHPYLALARAELAQCADNGDSLRFSLTEALLWRVAWPGECRERFRDSVARLRPRCSPAPGPATNSARQSGSLDTNENGSGPSGPSNGRANVPIHRVRSSPALFDSAELATYRAQAMSLGHTWDKFYPPESRGAKPFADVEFADVQRALAFRDLIWAFDEEARKRATGKQQKSEAKGKNVVRDGPVEDSATPPVPREPQSPEPSDSQSFKPLEPDPDDDGFEDRNFTEIEANMIAELESLRPEISHGKVIKILDRAGWNLDRGAALLYAGDDESDGEAGDRSEEENNENGRRKSATGSKPASPRAAAAATHNLGTGPAHAEGAATHEGHAPIAPGTHGAAASHPASPEPAPQPHVPVAPTAPDRPDLPPHLDPSTKSYYNAFPTISIARLSEILELSNGSVQFAESIARGELLSDPRAIVKLVRERLGVVGGALDDDLILDVFGGCGSIDACVEMCRGFVG